MEGVGSFLNEEVDDLQCYFFVGDADSVEEGVPQLRVDHVDDFLGVGVLEYILDFVDIA